MHSEEAAALGSNPQAAVPADQKAKNAAFLECGRAALVECLKGCPVKSCQPARCTNPEEPIVRARECLHHVLRQTILCLPKPKSEVCRVFGQASIAALKEN